MIAAADTWLLGLHQRIVDASGRTPRWWVEQCAIADGLLDIVVWAVGPRGMMPAVFLALGLALAAASFLFARSPELMATWYGATWNRQLCLCLCVAGLVSDGVLAAIGLPFTAHSAACDLGSATWTCLVFFAACKPPAPRPPKRRAVLSTGAA